MSLTLRRGLLKEHSIEVRIIMMKYYYRQEDKGTLKKSRIDFRHSDAYE
jgi:predicted class III extradiol MEMO1 family dioxygenase